MSNIVKMGIMGAKMLITVICDGWGILQRRKGDEHMLKMGILDGDVNHSNMRWLGHIT